MDATERTRSFAALLLPEATRRQLGALRATLAELSPRVPWLRPESLHVTLFFLGDADATQLAHARRCVAAAAAATAPFELRLSGGGAFPDERRPRVLWVGCDHGRGDLQRLQSRIAACLARALAAPTGDSPAPSAAAGAARGRAQAFRPHVTLARMRPGTSATAALTALRAFEAPPEPVLAIELVASHLGSEGARYTTLEHCRLGVG